MHLVLILVHFVRLHGIKCLPFATSCGTVMLRNKARLKFVFGSILLGLAVTLASALRISELDLSSDRVEPCVMIIFEFPQKQTSYGFPAYWFSSMEIVRKYGCGPIVSRYVTYSLLFPGFLIDAVLYTICCGALLHLRDRYRHVHTGIRVSVG
jgi:hypothetical protein